MGITVTGRWEIMHFPTPTFSTDFNTGHGIKMYTLLLTTHQLSGESDRSWVGLRAVLPAKPVKMQAVLAIEPAVIRVTSPSFVNMGHKNLPMKGTGRSGTY